MNRFLPRLLVCVSLTAMLAGCTSGSTSTPSTTVDAGETASVGDTVDIGDGLSVTLLSVDESIPPAAIETSPTRSAHWIIFEVTNTADTSVTLPGRPLVPTVSDADAQALEITGTTAELIDGGGGWGPAGARRGEPYLNPGGIMRAAIEVPSLGDRRRPFTITYAPTRAGTATFEVQ